MSNELVFEFVPDFNPALGNVFVREGSPVVVRVAEDKRVFFDLDVSQVSLNNVFIKLLLPST